MNQESFEIGCQEDEYVKYQFYHLFKEKKEIWSRI